MDDSKRPERPPPDADSAEIARWMEEDFGRAIAEAAEEHAKGDEHGGRRSRDTQSRAR